MVINQAVVSRINGSQRDLRVIEMESLAVNTSLVIATLHRPGSHALLLRQCCLNRLGHLLGFRFYPRLEPRDNLPVPADEELSKIPLDFAAEFRVGFLG